MFKFKIGLNIIIPLIVVILIILIVFSILKNKQLTQMENFDANYLTYKDVSLQNKIRELLKNTNDILTSENISYWIIGGTLLGAYRNQDVIPWSDDSAISILDTDVSKFENTIPIFNKMKYNVIKNMDGYKIINMNNNFPILNIFIVIQNKEGLYEYKSANAKKIWRNESYYHNDIFPLKTYKFSDFELNGPNNPIGYLNKLYGIGWHQKACVVYNEGETEKKHCYNYLPEIRNSNKYKLWLYWDGNMPEYIRLCIKTIYKHCSDSFDIVMLNNNNIRTYIPELNLLKFDILTLPIQQRVDYYRLILLYKYGGIYMDTDIIVLKDLKDITDKLNNHDFVGFGCTGAVCNYGYNKPSNWLMAAKPESLLMKNCIINITNKLMADTSIGDKINKSVDYHALGKMIIWEELEKLSKTGYKYYHYTNDYDGTRDNNGHWVTMERMFSNEKINYTYPDKLMFIVLYNSNANEVYRIMSESRLLSTDTNYAKYINMALKN